MNSRIIRDIRFYELKPDDYMGDFDGALGNVYDTSNDTKYIGQRIARKLNEYKFVSGEFDHIYINFSTKLNEDEIIESSVLYDRRIKNLNYGIKPSKFNKLTESGKDKKIKEITFNTLRWMYANDNNIHLINDTKNLMDKHNKLLTIKYKAKKTSNYQIDLSFQIKPYDDLSKLIIDYINNKDNCKLQGIIDVYDYEDLYSLIDKVAVKDNYIIFQPKKSYQAQLISKKYNNPPLKLDMNKMIKE